MEITDDLIGRQPPEGQANIHVLLANIAALEERLERTWHNFSKSQSK